MFNSFKWSETEQLFRHGSFKCFSNSIGSQFCVLQFFESCSVHLCVRVIQPVPVVPYDKEFPRKTIKFWITCYDIYLDFNTPSEMFLLFHNLLAKATPRHRPKLKSHSQVSEHGITHMDRVPVFERHKYIFIVGNA